MATDLLKWAKRVPVDDDRSTDGKHAEDWKVVKILIERKAASTLRAVCKLYLAKAGRQLSAAEFGSFYTCMVRRAQRQFGPDYQKKYFSK